MTATSSRKVTTPRRPAPQRETETVNGQVVTGQALEPLLVIGETPPEEPRHEVLFHLDGKNYEMLVNPAPADMTEYLHLSRTEGINAAFDWAMSFMLSDEAYEVLRTDRRVSKDDFQKLSVIVVQTLLGVDRKEAAANAAAGMIPKGASNGRRR